VVENNAELDQQWIGFILVVELGCGGGKHRYRQFQTCIENKLAKLTIQSLSTPYNTLQLSCKEDNLAA